MRFVTSTRSEGLFFAANSVLSKSVTGLGTLVSGVMLTWVHFPANAKPGTIDPALMHELGYIYVPVGLTLGLLSLYALSYLRAASTASRTNPISRNSMPRRSRKSERSLVEACCQRKLRLSGMHRQSFTTTARRELGGRYR